MRLLHSKTCSKCGGEKPLEEFYRDTNVKGGRKGTCIPCYIAQRRDYSSAYSKTKAYRRSRIKYNKSEEGKATKAASEVKRRRRKTARRCTKCREVKPRSEFHKDRTRPGGTVPWCKACAKEFKTTGAGKDAQRKFDASKKGHRAKARYSRTDRGKKARARVAKQRESAIIATENLLTEEEWQAILAKHPKCLVCLRDFSEELPATKDHIVPLVGGGLHTASNIQPLCRSCNSRKGAS